MAQTLFGKYLRDKRVEAGLSLRTVAKELGISFAYLGEVERGERAPLYAKYWPEIIKTIKGTTHKDLQEMAEKSKFMRLDIPYSYYDLGLALKSRIEAQDISEKDLMKIINILK